MTQLLPNHSLSDPWELTFGPDNMLWVTTRSSKSVLRIDPETGERDFLVAIHDVFQASTQDGLLGMALHPELGMETGNDFVYLSHTYNDDGRRQKIVRYSYTLTGNDGSLGDPVDIITNLPASNDHNSGRLMFGADGMLYYSIGDQGKNQYENVCDEIMAQALPTQQEVEQNDWQTYQGKILRIALDGSIPTDNPEISGVRSHIFSYGHRNPQGLVLANDGSMFSAEHGPKSDDEINLIQPGMNYGWPYVAGYQDNRAYQYCNWSSSDNCGRFDDYGCPNDAAQMQETDWQSDDFMPPLRTFYTVDDDYDFVDPECNILFICWPTIAPSSIDIYEQQSIPEWGRSLLVVSLKLGRIFRQPIDENGETIGEAIEYWNTQNRYREIAVNPNGLEFYVITDNRGQTSGPSSGNTDDLDNPGSILKFKYLGGPLVSPNEPVTEHVLISPNPITTEANVTFSDQIRTAPKSVMIINLNGQILAQKDEVMEEYRIPQLNSGIYLLQTAVEGVVLTKRFVVAK